MDEKNTLPAASNTDRPQLPEPSQQVFEHHGNGPQIANVFGGVHIEGLALTAEDLVSALAAIQSNSGSKKSYALEWHELSKTQYNLFVMNDENFSGETFSIPKKSALIHPYTDQITAEQFWSLNNRCINDLRSFPCIFARRNPEFKHCDSGFPAYIGRITEISVQTDVIQFGFKKFQHLYQTLLNENTEDFSLLQAPLRNELDVEHWAIKSCNLIQTLENLGIVIQ